MDRENVKKTVFVFIQDILDGSEVEITEESGLMEELELSSLEIMTMVSDIEEKYHIVLSETDIRKIISVGDLVDCVYNKVNED